LLGFEGSGGNAGMEMGMGRVEEWLREVFMAVL
jgi:hypothetical protein